MDLYQVFLFILITSVTPGPNNIACFVFSASLGFKKILPFIAGIVSGVALILSVIGLLVDVLSGYIETLDVYLKWVAAAYILFLAYKSLRITISEKKEDEKSPSYLTGVLLQFVNPKFLLFALTFHAGFLYGHVDTSMEIILASVLTSSATLTSVVIYALAGNFIMDRLKNPKIQRIVGVVMALVLVWFAISLVF